MESKGNNSDACCIAMFVYKKIHRQWSPSLPLSQAWTATGKKFVQESAAARPKVARSATSFLVGGLEHLLFFHIFPYNVGITIINHP